MPQVSHQLIADNPIGAVFEPRFRRDLNGSGLGPNVVAAIDAQPAAGRPADTAYSPGPSPASGPATTPAEPLAAALVAAVAGLYGKVEMDGLPTTEISTGNSLRAARTELENAVRPHR